MSSRYGISRTALLVVMTLPFLYPFAFLISTALKPVQEFSGDPVGWVGDPTLQNVGNAWTEGGLGKAMLNSLIAVGVAVIVTVLISAAGAYWLSLHSGRIATAIKVVIIGSMALPPPVFIIPLFVLLGSRGLTDNLVVLGVVFAAWNAGFGMYLMLAYFKGLPTEITEAARVDGASLVQQFVRIIVPLSKPAIATLAALTFLWSWSDLLLSVVLIPDPDKRPLTAAVALLSDQFDTDTPRLAAAVLIGLLPILIVFLVGQRYIARGIAAGVGK